MAPQAHLEYACALRAICTAIVLRRVRSRQAANNEGKGDEDRVHVSPPPACRRSTIARLGDREPRRLGYRELLSLEAIEPELVLRAAQQPPVLRPVLVFGAGIADKRPQS